MPRRTSTPVSCATEFMYSRYVISKFPRADTRTIDNDDVSKLALNDHLSKERTPNKDCVNNMTQKQPKKRLRCVFVDVSDGEA
ncbi:hypothetical protein DPMN_064456 [Dreissena polymorpha]|uniref:Uncharacterized protein n=1 Tax=Dreissena polymorpha TaxID=45954 RepID=A0A9D4CCA4_DREPO|nr:hypothetical protein DPMN_064456 [Dreissena polymorpha]